MRRQEGTETHQKNSPNLWTLWAFVESVRKSKQRATEQMQKHCSLFSERLKNSRGFSPNTSDCISKLTELWGRGRSVLRSKKPRGVESAVRSSSDFYIFHTCMAQRTRPWTKDSLRTKIFIYCQFLIIQFWWVYVNCCSSFQADRSDTGVDSCSPLASRLDGLCVQCWYSAGLCL